MNGIRTLGLLIGAAFPLWAADFSLTVENGDLPRENVVVSQTVTREWAAEAKTHTLAEVTAAGTLPVPCGVDASGERPVLFWMLAGRTAPGALRRYVWREGPAVTSTPSDLALREADGTLSLTNGFFSLKHPVRGGGGFPCGITFSRSGHTDPDLYFLDRIVRQQPDTGRLVQYCARDCTDAETRVVFRHPLRVTLEASTGFGKRAADTPGHPQAVYRYTYTAFSPVVEVSTRYTREDDGPWRELHFLHLTRRERHYTQFVTGDGGQTHMLQAPGEKSRPVTGAQWGVMADGADACGTGFDGTLCWDASNEFVYYVRRACTPWQGATRRFDGGLYFGPSGDASWYASWLGRDRHPSVRLFKNGRPWVPVERETLTGAFELKNEALRIVFDEAAKGFDCLGIENRLGEGARFVRSRPDVPGLWSLTFKSEPDAAGERESVTLDNRSACTAEARRLKDGLIFTWAGLDLPGEPAAVDVRAEIRLAPWNGDSSWRIAVTNRGRRFGLWQSEYPQLRSVAEPGIADVLLPRGNWGGSLIHGFSGTYAGRYPSFGCPVQMLAYNIGDDGLLFYAADGEACAKELSVADDQDVTFRAVAANAGVAGSAGAPGYPVVVGAYSGDWWQAARRYRTWALRQPWTAKGPIRKREDYPKRMTDIGLWMQLGGEPSSVSRNMAEAARLYPGVPLGVHWYVWHMIPFDNSYPEYFPEKPGMVEATRDMQAAGQTVMPYINARLWDRDIPSFEAAVAASCKQPGGTNYVETYGSGRNLVPMCPYTRVWQAKVAEVCHRLMDTCGVGGIYLDQIGSAAPVVCYDPSHGHPVGGGCHWVAGYHEMLRPIKAEAARRGVLLTMEDSAEPYMDVIDGCLAWNARYDEDVPLLPAVYSGFTTYFTSPQSPSDTLDAFCAAQARDFLWGCQLGWNGDWILKEPHREKQRFQLELCRYRLALKAFLVYGQFMDELRPLNRVPRVSTVWNRRTPHTARLPAVMGSVWRDGEGRTALLVVNISSELQRLEVDLLPSEVARGRGRLMHVTPEGETEIPLKGWGAVLGDLRPHEIRALVLTPR